MDLFIIDAIGPFINKNKINCNWSKIPFNDLENLKNPKKTFDEIIESFNTFINKISKIGYNAISIDDLAHMVILDIYSSKLKNKLKEFSKLYQELFKICRQNNIKIFVNFDIMYFNNEIRKYTNKRERKIIDILKKSLDYLFENYKVDGIITRIGECDGQDVKGIFKSELTIKTPRQARYYLNNILPVLEKNNKIWIFRTWTIGGSKIGDLMWNQKTFLKVFENITSDNLIISMKYGESDFFRNMDLNQLFFCGNNKKIIELQTRREYDFFGELPYYTGWQYEEYYKQLKDNKNLKGIMVWCQTGGWFCTDKITFLENSSQFVELNTISTIEIFKGKNPDKIIPSQEQLRFLKKFNELSNKILYPKDSSKKYFRKLYVPPIIWIYWKNITINKFLSSFVKYIYKTCPIIEKKEFDELYNLGKICGFKDIDFYVETLKIVYSSRKTLHDKMKIDELKKEVRIYSKKYDFITFSIDKKRYSRILPLFFRLSFRNNKKNNFYDRLFFNKYAILVFYKLYFSINKKSRPHFLNKEAMPITTLIK